MIRVEVLDTINREIRNEKGRRVTEEDTLRDAGLDSFGITMFFCALDDKYSYFAKGGYGKNPFAEIQYDQITIREIIDTCVSENITTENPQ